MYVYIPYSGKLSRVKIFEVDLPQNISRIKFRGSTRLSLHLYTIINFRGLIFEVAVKSTKTVKFIVLENFPLYGIITQLKVYGKRFIWEQRNIQVSLFSGVLLTSFTVHSSLTQTHNTVPNSCYTYTHITYGAVP